MGMKTPVWFGIGLGAALFFLWCLVSALETGLHAGWIWGLVVSGVIGIVALAIAVVRFWGGTPAVKDPLLRAPVNDRLRGNGDVPRARNEVPQSASGRSLV